jgi:hypothetical protein
VWHGALAGVLEKGRAQHPNDVMEEWKKLYKLVNSLFDEVAAASSGQLSVPERRKNDLILTLLLSKVCADNACLALLLNTFFSSEGAATNLSEDLRPLCKRLQLGEAAEVCLEF